MPLAQGILTLLLFSLTFSLTHAVYPIILQHGMYGDPNNYVWLAKRLNETLDVQTHIIQSDQKLYSVFKSIPQQALDLKNEIESLPSSFFTEGKINLICHSMGTMVCRYFIEHYGDKLNYKVSKFVSLAGVQGGAFGITRVLEEMIPFLKDWLRDDLHKIFYRELSQEHLSLANFWRDPLHYEEYLTGNTFFPIVNNEIPHPDSERYKRNFASLDMLVLCGSPADELLIPGSAAVFSPFAIGSAEVLVPTNQTEWYTKDLFGLRTLDEQQKMFLYFVPDVTHMQWLRDEELFQAYILKHLQD